jgi:CarD family transcriptional regulator
VRSGKGFAASKSTISSIGIYSSKATGLVAFPWLGPEKADFWLFMRVSGTIAGGSARVPRRLFFWGREEEESLYKVGDKVVYPHHGAGTVVKKETRTVLKQQRVYLTIKILHNDMTVNVPAENAERVGLRKVIDEEMVEEVLEVLHGEGTKMPKNWNRRFKFNRDKMKTGDIFELAEVVRNLSLRDQEKGLSTGEKQMFVKAKKILASELMYAKGLDEDEAAAWLDEVLTEVAVA